MSVEVRSHSICWLCKKKEHGSGVAFIRLMGRLPFVDQVAQEEQMRGQCCTFCLFPAVHVFLFLC